MCDIKIGQMFSKLFYFFCEIYHKVASRSMSQLLAPQKVQKLNSQLVYCSQFYGFEKITFIFKDRLCILFFLSQSQSYEQCLPSISVQSYRINIAESTMAMTMQKRENKIQCPSFSVHMMIGFFSKNKNLGSLKDNFILCKYLL